MTILQASGSTPVWMMQPAIENLLRFMKGGRKKIHGGIGKSDNYIISGMQETITE